MERGNTFLRRIDKTIGPPILITVSLFKFYNKKIIPISPETIGILCLGAIGDLVLAAGALIPALKEQYPTARVILVISQANAALSSLIPHTDEIIEINFKNLRAASRELRRSNFDILIDTTQWARIGAVLSYVSTSKYTIGFKTNGQRRHYAYDVSVEHRNDRHEIENFRSLLSPLGIKTAYLPTLKIAAGARIKAKNWSRQQPYIVCHPWASGLLRRLKEWPNEHWRVLARSLVSEGYDVVFTGAPADQNAADELLEPLHDLGGSLRNVTGQMSLMETAAIIEQAEALVSVNTGIMHIGAALNVPLVEMNGPTTPVRWGPISRNAVSLVAEGEDASYLNLGWEHRPDAKPVTGRIKPEQVLASLWTVMRKKHHPQRNALKTAEV